MSARERFFEKVKQNQDAVPPGKNTVEAEIQTFRLRMDALAQQIDEWFAGSGIEIVQTIKNIHDMSTVGYSLSSGICRYGITAIHLQNGERSVSISPERLCCGAERGYVTLRVVDASGALSDLVFNMSMAPDAGWYIWGEHQIPEAKVLMTEDVFFRVVERLA